MDSRLRGNDTVMAYNLVVIPVQAGIHARCQQETSRELTTPTSWEGLGVGNKG
jgi:hypothetical protein